MTLSVAQRVLAQPTLELCPEWIEQRVICAYIGLLFTPQVGERRATTVGWLGTREIRLTEIEPDNILADTPPF